MVRSHPPRSPSILAASAAVALLAGLPVLAARGAEETSNETGWAEHDSCLHGRLERAAGAAAGDLYDEQTGRDLRHFAPDRLVDYLHMTLEMRFEDLDDARFVATETLRFRPIGPGVDGLTLDAVGLDIREATLDGHAVEHYHDGNTLTLRFPGPLDPAREYALGFDYVCADPVDGMVFTPAAPEVGYTAEVHTQGQSDTNRHWFIAHDFPNERLATELIVDVPARFAVSSNGRLVSHDVRDDRAVWHYLQERPHVSYLVSLVIGEFDIVRIPHDRVDMQVWGQRGTAADILGTFGRTGEMIDLFEERFGVPYPWDRYDQLCVKNFGAGGMENTSATSLYPSAVLTETARRDRDLDSLIAHELAHQWTGDLLTCKTWAHIWLNEGWATYGESLWFEHRDGPDGYFDDMRDNFRVARRDRTDTNDTPMVSPAYDSPDDVFGRAANPYPKGASILHMLRMELGEHDFWAGVRQYMNERADDVVETNDLRYALEASSGRSLEHFFEQWCYRPGTPDLHVDVRFDGRDRALEIEVEQRQQMSIVTPAFVFTLPVHVRTASGWTVHEIDVDSRLTSYRVVLDGPPDVVAVDPELHVLKTVEVDKPFAMWMAQIDAGPTVVARHAAIDAIGERDEPEVAARLAGLIRDESVRHTLRITAARALAGLGSRHARATFVELVDTPIDEPRVRRALVDGLAGVDREIAVSRLLDAAAADASEACRVAAIRGLARHRATEATSLLVDLVNVPSQHDDIRRAALDALADLDASEGLDRAIECAAYGHLDRARPTAIATMATLAHHDTERVVPLLVGYLDDPEGRTVNAAIDALGRVNTDESRQALQRVADTSVDAGRRRRAERALESPGGEGRRRRGG